jgi:eukaryotic-like serine/threonine-protein kinase
MVGNMDQPSRDSILAELNRVLSSALFQGASRSRTLLKYLVEGSLSGKAGGLKEYTIGVEALGRGESFDPRTDPIVRAEASRLRGRLERFYATEGRKDGLTILLPKGSYVPQFRERRLETEESRVSTRREFSRSRWLLQAAVYLLVVACGFAAGLLFHLSPKRASGKRLLELDVALISRGVIGGEVGPAVILSPDGTRTVFTAMGTDGVTRLYSRRLDRLQVTQLPGTDGARVPFFSPDGLWVGFETAGKLKKTPVDGGSPVVLCDVPNLLGASWGEDGYIIAAFGAPTLVRVSSDGGVPKVILDLSKEAETPVWPQVLSGGKLVLYTAMGFAGPNHASIRALSLTTGKTTQLAAGGTFARVLKGSILTYVNQGTLFALPFDLERVTTRGPPTPVLDGVSYSSTFGFAELDFSRSGDLVYRKDSGGRAIVQRLEGAGRTEPFLSRPGHYLWPRVSPDGKRLALSVTDSGESGVRIYEGPPERFTRLRSPVGRYRPLWTPNGRFLVLGGTEEIIWLPADGSGKPHTLVGGASVKAPWSFSPDGTRLAYHQLNQSTGFDLWTVPVHISPAGLTAGSPELFLRTRAFEVYPTFSPDGHWIAYGSNESGTSEVYVRSFPDNGEKVQVSAAGGRIPFWSRDGSELFYRTDDQRIMVANYAIQGGSFVVRSVRLWSPVRLADSGVLANLDLDPNGKGFLALTAASRPEDLESENHATLVLNFVDEVERRLASVPR